MSYVENYNPLPKTITEGEVSIPEQDEVAAAHSKSSLTIRYDYLNNTGEEIVVVDNRNNKFRIMPFDRHIGMPRGLLMYESFEFDAKVKFNSASHSTVDKDSTSASLLARLVTLALDKDADAIKRTGRRTRTVGVCVKNHLEKSDLAERRGIYLRNLDVVVGLAIYADEIIHPRSDEGVAMSHRMSNGGSGLNLKILIVDPFRKLGSRWINVNGALFRIDPVYDSALEEGIYFADGKQTSMKDIRLSLEDGCEKLRLFATQEQARTYGDLKDEELRQRQLEAEESKRSYEQLKLQLEKENLLLKDEQAKSTLINTRIDTETKTANGLRDYIRSMEERHQDELIAERKFRNEMHSMERKDSSELLKWLPGIIIGMGALIFANR